MRPGGKPKQNTVEAQVVTTEYQGSSVKVTLDITGKAEFAINLLDADSFTSGLPLSAIVFKNLFDCPLKQPRDFEGQRQ